MRRRSSRNPNSAAADVARLLGLLAFIGIFVALAGFATQALRGTGATGLPEIPPSRIPPAAFAAYRDASAQAGDVAPGCEVDWAILAGLARIESKHGQPDDRHEIGPEGEVTPFIRGPSLDGSRGTLAVMDTDGGALDGDATWDRAMGPFQFIPTTWSELGRDGNGDGVADPDNLHDAAVTAIAHLCLRQPGDYGDRSQLRRALVGYNASGRYADAVLGWIDRYRTQPLEELLGEPS